MSAMAEGGASNPKIGETVNEFESIRQSLDSLKIQSKLSETQMQGTLAVTIASLTHCFLVKHFFLISLTGINCMRNRHISHFMGKQERESKEYNF